MERIGEIKSYIRDINLNMITSPYKIEVDMSKRKDRRFQILRPNNKLIKYVTKMGGVLTGSRALKCYTINDKSIIDRGSIDWDFLVTKDMVFDICDHFGVEYNLVDKVISIKKCKWWSHPAYSDSYRVGPVDVQLIIKDEFPDFIEKDGVKICTFNYILNEKIKLIDAGGKDIKKHIEDLTQVIIKFNCLK
jgi:hypothetical protein